MMLAVAVAELNAVDPPLVLTSAVLPAAPLVWSHARNVTPLVTVPLKSALGTNRMRVLASAASSREDVLLGVPKAFQFVPASVEYCHAPLVLSTAVTATPDDAPLSLS